MQKQVEDQKEISVASTTQEPSHSENQSTAEKPVADIDNLAEETKPGESGSDGASVSKGRPMSPSTLALMCDEQDTMFATAAAPNRLDVHSNASSQLPLEQGMTEAYGEQERIVLTKFRDCLNRLITLGEIKGESFIFSFSNFVTCLQIYAYVCFVCKFMHMFVSGKLMKL